MQAITFLLDAVASFFCTLFLLRFMMQAMRVSFAGQIGDFVVKLTNWAIKPLRRFIPGLGGFDWASLLAALGVQLALSGILREQADELVARYAQWFDNLSIATQEDWVRISGTRLS